MQLRKTVFYTSVILLVIYTILSYVVFTILNYGLHMMMAWNLILAFIPLLFVFLIQHHQEKIWLVIPSFFLWLFFYPNSIYMITDFIYINSTDFMSFYGDSLIISEYIADFNGYLGLFHILFGVVLGIYFGMLSLKTMYQYITTTKFNIYRDFGVVGVTLLSGLAIYIGRFFRYNSWEFFRIKAILTDLFQSLSWFTVFFILTVALFQLMIFYLFVKEKSPSE